MLQYFFYGYIIYLVVLSLATFVAYGADKSKAKKQAWRTPEKVLLGMSFFGGAFGGYAVMALLGAFGYNTAAGAVQTAEAVKGLWILMSWVPAAVAALAIVIVFFYPLTKSRMEKIQEELAVKRNLK